MPVSKKNKKPKKDKKNKIKPTKTIEERTIFVENMKKQFLDLGCYPAQYSTIEDFFKILDDYQNEATPASGKLSFEECPFGGRDIFYILSNKKNIENVVHFLMKNRPKDTK